MTQPGGGLGSLSNGAATIHAGFGPSPADVNYLPSTKASSDGRSAVGRGHGKGSSTQIGAMVEEMKNTGGGGSEKSAGGSWMARHAAWRDTKCGRWV
jgi:hypothetical protein